MRWPWLMVILCGCFQSNAVVCEDGRICPDQTTCLQLSASNELLCGLDEDIAACRDHAEFDACTLRGGLPGACYGDTTGGLVCQPTGCGNAITDPGEVCDDGNAETGDRCSYSCRSNESCGNGFIDPVRLVAGQPTLNEVCDDANLMGRDGCTSGCQLETSRWQSIVISSGPVLADARMTYDPIRQRMLLFGGTPDGRDLHSEIWEWDGAAWSHRAAGVAPSARMAHAFDYDLSLHQAISFGGSSGVQGTADTWRWDGESWTSLAPAMNPSRRSRFGSAYDTRRKRLVVFGGQEVAPADTWEWNGETWKELPTPAGLQATRFAPVMAYDPVRDRIVMAGGGGVTAFQDTWELDGDTWVQVADATTTPSSLAGGAMAYDAVGRRMLVYGGGVLDATLDPIARTLAWDGQHWTDLGQTTPGPLRRAAIASDPIRRQIVMHGGAVAGCIQGCIANGQTWIWNGSQWSAPSVAATPGKRTRMAAAYDPARSTLVMFGGLDANVSPGLLGDTWEQTDGHWTRVATTGPAPRFAAAMAYDAAHQRMVLFGGRRVNGATLPAETWLWDGSAWSLATPATSPTPRSGTAMAYDQARGRVVMFGGLGPLSETWEWDGVTWLQRMPVHVPPPRTGHSLAYDFVARKVTLFGGVGGSPVIETLGDTWTWDGTDWTEALSSPGAARQNTAIAWNPARRRLTLFGGLAGLGAPTALDDTWEWDRTAWHQLFVLDPPAARLGHLMFPATDGTGIVVYGGSDGSIPGIAPASFDDLARLSYNGSAPYESCAAGIDLDRDGLAGCSDPDCGARCAPFCVATEIGSAACAASGARCGDGTCDAPRESCRLCPGDCGPCTPACGDGFCDPGEACLGDCP